MTSKFEGYLPIFHQSLINREQVKNLLAPKTLIATKYRMLIQPAFNSG